MSARYQIRLKNQQGVQVALTTDESPDFRSFYCTRVRNAPGVCRLEVDGSLAALFEPDSQIELLRRAPELGIEEWCVEWEGFHVSEERLFHTDNTRSFVSHGMGYLDLVRREEIGYFAGTAYVDKNGVGETVIKAFVDENVGPGASSTDRIDDGVMPGLSIQPDQARGLAWEGSRAWKPLLSTIQEIADATGLAFDVVGIGPALFEFQVYEGQRGSDRTTAGLSQATGKNAAGNAPVVFSTELGNMIEASLHVARGDEINVVYVLGQGEQNRRSVLPVKDALAIAVSPWNRRVEARNASQDADTALQSTGDAVLAERRLKKVFSFQPVDTESTVYGRHYFFGDRVTAKYEDVEVDVEIAEVQITVNESGEELRFQFR